MSEMKKQNIAVNIIGPAIIILLVAIAYKTTFIWMFNRYIGADSYYSHGFLVPIIFLYLIFLQKERLARIEKQKSILGLFIIFFALFLHLLGTILYVFSISGFSLFFLIIGMSLFLYGKEVLKIIGFPIIFLIFMFPMPEAVISLISFPLKIFAAKAGVWIVSLTGIPIYLEGFNIIIPAGHLLVGNPCSGLRSLIAFMALGSILAHLELDSMIKKWILFFLSIPIAVLSNIIRIPILILISNYWGLEAASPDTLVHTGSGLLVFVLGFLLIFVVARMLKYEKH